MHGVCRPIMFIRLRLFNDDFLIHSTARTSSPTQDIFAKHIISEVSQWMIEHALLPFDRRHIASQSMPSLA